MTHQFFAFAWPVSAHEAAAQVDTWVEALINRHGWVTAYAGEGLCVLHKGVRTEAGFVLLPGDQGVILGTLFPKEPDSDICVPIQAWQNDEMPRLGTSIEEALVRHYWGRYVAFRSDAKRGLTRVLRDPSGGFPCFSTQLEGVSIFVSNVPDLAALEAFTPSFNWRYVIETFFNLETVDQETGLSNLVEILPGEMMVRAKDRMDIEAAWSPLDIVSDQQIVSFDEAVEQTRSVTKRCVNSWASLYGSIFHNLSGGVDSAIVLASMAEADNRPNVTCVNYYTAAAGGDERSYARLAAEKAGYKMIDLEMPISLDLEALVVNSLKTSAPTGDIFSAPTAEALVDVAQQLGSDVFFSGEGGDHLFFELKTPLVAVDYMRDKGLSKKMLSVMLDTAHFTGQSFWHVMRQALKCEVLERGKPPLPEYPDRLSALLRSDVRSEFGGPYPLHHWVNGAANVPPAKWIQIYALLQALQRRKSPIYGQVAEVRNPLLSQPLIELCLSIPSYLAIEGGQGRAIARKAFADGVPREILKRRAKGTTESYFHELLKRNHRYIEEMILDGRLVREGMLHKEKALEFIRTRHLKDGEAIRIILRLVATEAWISAWS